MPWGAVAGAVVGAVANNVLNSGSSGPSPGQSAGQFYVPSGLGGADLGWQQLFGQMTGDTANLSNQIMPAFNQTFSDQSNISGAPLVQAGQTAGGEYGNLANLSQIYGGTLGGLIPQQLQQMQQMQGAGSQILNTSMDPQNQLYNQLFNQNQQQAGGVASMFGLGNSPVGASMVNQADQQFNMSWENQQLARQLQGIQGAGQANLGADQINQMLGQNLSGSMGMFGNTPGYTLQSAQTPITYAQQGAQVPSQAGLNYLGNINQLLAGLSIPQGQAIPYMNYGQGAQTGAFNAALGAANFNAGQNASNVNLGMQLGNAFGKSSAGQGFGNWLGGLFGSGGGGSSLNAGDYSALQGYGLAGGGGGVSSGDVAAYGGGM